MKIGKKMEDALNAQIGYELGASYAYLSMAAYFQSSSLPGFSKWMRKQSMEEHVHAMKIFEYVHERGGSVELDAIGKPKEGWKSPLETFKDAYEMEIANTKRIDGLFETAIAESDTATRSFLKWFIDEQVEEEATALEIIEKLKRAEGNGGAILMLDSELGKLE